MKIGLRICLLLISFIGILLVSRSAPGQETKPFFLPKNPVAAAYVLGRLSNQELIEAPRSEFVYVALLQRDGLDQKYRLEALEGLANERGTDPLTELLRGLQELDPRKDASIPVLLELAGLLFQHSPEDLRKKEEDLRSLAVESLQPVTRQSAFAALSIISPLDELWDQARQAGKMADLLSSAQLIRDLHLRGQFFERAVALLNHDDPEVQRAAMLTLPAVPGREPEAFTRLAELLKEGRQRETAVAALQKIPRKLWPHQEAPDLAEALAAWLQTVPQAERTSDFFLEARQFAFDLTSLLPVEQARPLNRLLDEMGVRVIVIRTLYEQMLYDRSRIAVEAGKPIEIVFENDDIMPHNLVITVPGAVEEIGVAADQMPAQPDSQGRLYVPDSPKVLWATRMLNPGQKEKLSFTAPVEPGEYPYVCTYPGHWRRMVGTMLVVPDLDEYLAVAPAEEEVQYTEWTFEDLQPLLPQVSTGRNLARGRELFTALACAQCHTLGGEGYYFGPDLEASMKEWNGDRARLLQEIIDPAHTIEERYRNHTFELANGDTVSGMIIMEDEHSVTIHSGPADSLIQTLSKKELVSREARHSSLMPSGLLNTLSPEEILDLLAYIESGGKTAHNHPHHHSHQPVD